MKNSFNEEETENVIFITFYCKWCRKYKTQPISLEDYNMNIRCWYCNNYGVLLSNEYGNREWFRDGLNGKYFGGYNEEKLNESYGGPQFRKIAEGGIKRKR